MPSMIALQSGAAAFFFLFAILLLAVSLAMIVWTYQDAQANSSQPAFLWALVVFFAPFLGIVLYFLVGRDRY
ncbi:PLDc N-terminal domain-containing protein [Halosimplex aquaticum]|uniref:PLDc N-terminal domain-containing protein n=1 Tax=Halosimplex aquaticum TaxID=3026162 RepID=A0ABD5Y5N9_9EURY|nr:PLDc N-terminal domain-containing protein [Halosimplex aquaticum]